MLQSDNWIGTYIFVKEEQSLYRVTKQLGVVYGETVFKASAGQQLISSLGDAFRTFSFSAKEMKGHVAIIEEARKFAYVKMMPGRVSMGLIM